MKKNLTGMPQALGANLTTKEKQKFLGFGTQATQFEGYLLKKKKKKKKK
jgi:ABC-type microcin C transport system permease subunit YejE